MLDWLHRQFSSWSDVFDYLVFLVVCLAGVVHASGLWIVIGAMLLFLLSWPRWSELIAKAGKVDTDYRELGRLAFVHRLLRESLTMYSKARLVPLVLGVKFFQDALFSLAPTSSASASPGSGCRHRL